MPVRERPARPLGTIDGPWTVHFTPGWGAPASITLPHLEPWTQNADPDVRYYSGVASYEKTIDVPAGWLAHRHLTLDLGTVGEVAEVRVNGALAGTAWKPPYAVDLSGAVHAGRNLLQIRVANVWRNRFVGDQQPGAHRYAFSNTAAGGGFAALGGVIDKDTPLIPSGLVGPIVVWGD